MPEEGSSNIEGRPHIFPMPTEPLEMLKRMHTLLGVRLASEGRRGWGIRR